MDEGHFHVQAIFHTRGEPIVFIGRMSFIYTKHWSTVLYSPAQLDHSAADKVPFPHPVYRFDPNLHPVPRDTLAIQNAPVLADGNTIRARKRPCTFRLEKGQPGALLM